MGTQRPPNEGSSISPPRRQQTSVAPAPCQRAVGGRPPARPGLSAESLLSPAIQNSNLLRPSERRKGWFPGDGPRVHGSARVCTVSPGDAISSSLPPPENTVRPCPPGAQTRGKAAPPTKPTPFAFVQRSTGSHLPEFPLCRCPEGGVGRVAGRAGAAVEGQLMSPNLRFPTCRIWIGVVGPRTQFNNSPRTFRTVASGVLGPTKL